MNEQDLIRAIGRLEGKIDSIIMSHANIESRVTTLERAWSKLLGAAAIVAAAGTWITNKLLT